MFCTKIHVATRVRVVVHNELGLLLEVIWVFLGAMIFFVNLSLGNSNPNETWVPWSVKGMAMVELLKKQQ